MSEDDSHRSSINILAIINTAFTKIRVDQKLQPRLWNKWLPAETWVEALKTSNLIDEALTLNVRSFNTAMARSKSEFNGLLIERFDGSNTTGVFRVTFQKQKYYYITNQNAQVSYPKPLDNKWKADVLGGAKDVLRMRATRSNTSAGGVTDNTINTALVSKSQQRKRRFDSIADDNDKRHNTDVIPATLVSHPPDIHTQEEEEHQQNQIISGVISNENVPPVTVVLPPKMFYWNSQDASNLFGIKLERPEDDVRNGLMLRIKQLRSVGRDQNGWRNVIEGQDPDNICSGYDIFAIRGRSMTLCLAYQIAIVNMNVWTWEECCTEACQQLNQLGMEQATHHRTVQDWNNEFRTCGSFPHPNHSVRCGKRPMPPLFAKYPMAMDDIIAFGVKNLTTLTVEVVHSFCHDHLIPKLLLQWQDDMIASKSWSSDSRDCLTKEMFLREHGITTLSIPTCWRWLHHLGFTYDVQRKGYYVDGHERSDVVEAREQFCKVYLTELEPRCLRWVQFSVDELEAYPKLRPEVAYQYVDDAGTLSFEFHVDYCSNKGIQVDGDDAILVPKMSVRAPAESTPIEIFGQDESVFSQFLFLPKSWVGPNKERGLFPKSIGEGYMISAFVSRDSGFGLPLTEEQLQLINAYRHGKQYVDKAAALEILKTVEKPPLTETPFVRGLLIGASKGGYWNSFHMALQFEDTVDCLKVLNPEIDLVFLFDHSQGHARKKDGALDANDMSRSFGGVQPKMRSTIMVDGCLGPYDRILNVGDCQSMVYEPDDVGPWWFSTDETRESRRHDIIDNDNFKMVNRTRAQLAQALNDAGIAVDSTRPVDELKVFAIQHGIALQQKKVHAIEGWQGKAKGLLQILWERGWIDPSKCSKLDKSGKMFNTSFYSLKGKTDHTGMMNEPSSLRYLMGSCTDFQEEETALQHLGSQLGCKVIFTPKFHCELAGEGIEYNWAHAKAKMRATPLREKKGRANFINLVKKCICPATVLTKERVSKFAARARAYICTYYHLAQRAEEDANDVAGAPSIHISHKQQLLFKEIERLMKQFKTHRCALDFDQAFVKAELREEGMAS